MDFWLPQHTEVTSQTPAHQPGRACGDEDHPGVKLKKLHSLSTQHEVHISFHYGSISTGGYSIRNSPPGEVQITLSMAHVSCSDSHAELPIARMRDEDLGISCLTKVPTPDRVCVADSALCHHSCRGRVLIPDCSTRGRRPGEASRRGDSGLCADQSGQ